MMLPGSRLKPQSGTGNTYGVEYIFNLETYQAQNFLM